MEHPVAVPVAGSALPSLRSRTTVADAPLPDSHHWAALLGDPPLSPSELHSLATLSSTRPWPAGQALLNRNVDAQALVALASGEAALGWRSADGTFRTERVVHGPAWLDQSAAWLGAPHALDAQSLSPVTVLQLPVAGLSRCLAQQPGLVQRLIGSLAAEVQALALNTHELMHKDAPARLAQWLSQRLQPAEGQAGQDGQAVVRLNERKRDVASQLAITPETLSRLMRSFSRQGVIEVSGYLVRVLDVAALGALARA